MSFYKTWTDNKDTTKLGSTNYWSLANMVNNYGRLTYWGILFLTQLLSLFGIAPALNMTLWGLLLSWVFVSVEVAWGVLQLLGIMAAQSWSSSTTSTAEQTIAYTMASTLSNEWFMQTAGNAFSFVILWENYAGWVKANSMDMPKEEEGGEKVEEIAKLFAQGLFAF